MGVLQSLSSVLLFFALWFLWPRELDGFNPGRDGHLSVPDYAMTNARYVSVKEGRIELESISQDATYRLADHLMEARTVTAYFYNQAGLKTEVQADRGYFYMDKRQVVMKENVRSLSPDGFALRGTEAIYDVAQKVLTAPQPVEGDTQDKSLKVWGDTAVSSLNERTVELKGNARGEFIEKKRGLTKIRGDRAFLDREKQKVTFHENVRVDQDKIIGTSKNALLFYAGKEKGVRYMSLLDDVKIVEQQGRYTRSQVAEFFAPTDTIVLSVFPAVYHGDDMVTGDRITLYRATGVVEVMAANAAGNPQSTEKKSFSTEDEELIP